MPRRSSRLTCGYIREARAAGAKPILVTPMVRRTFDAQLKIAEPPTTTISSEYVDAMKAIGDEKEVGLVITSTPPAGRLPRRRARRRARRWRTGPAT